MNKNNKLGHLMAPEGLQCLIRIMYNRQEEEIDE